MTEFLCRPIGIARSAYKQKFGIARQSGLVPDARAVIELMPEISIDCFRGIEQFDYLWIQFWFHGTASEGWSPLVRPPKLGGKTKIGVFATRSPHRPNPIGLSLVRFEKLLPENPLKLQVAGVDLLDGTPILDIKPYLPHIESQPQASCGFAGDVPILSAVDWSDNAQKFLTEQKIGQEIIAVIEQSLLQDPRPAHLMCQNRDYFMEIFHLNVRFSIANGRALVLSLSNI